MRTQGMVQRARLPSAMSLSGRRPTLSAAGSRRLVSKAFWPSASVSSTVWLVREVCLFLPPVCVPQSLVSGASPCLSLLLCLRLFPPQHHVPKRAAREAEILDLGSPCGTNSLALPRSQPGVLGVLPAISLRDAAQSGAYLSSFCVASILIMGVFGGCWGEVSGRIGSTARATFVLLVLSSFISLAVGVMWLTLIATGTFSSVFE